MQNFLAELNANFAIIENSPLFRGLPGSKGLPGSTITGPRGTIYIFTNFARFVSQFPELANSNASVINGQYLNTLLSDPSKRNQLLLALNVTFLNDTDIIVFESSTEMWQYSMVNDQLSNTGVSFSTNVNIAQFVQNELNTYLNNIMQSLQNQLTSIVLTNYSSVSRNSALNNGIEDHTFQSGSSQYFPILQGVVDASRGTIMSNVSDPTIAHRYLSFNDPISVDSNNVPINTTFIIGSVRRFIAMQQASMAILNQSNGLSTDYAPNSTNLPSIVLLQNNGNAGILIGRKDDSNLQSFASIHREANQHGALVLKSNYEPLDINNGILRLTSVRATWNKIFEIIGNVEIHGNLILSDDVQSIPTNSKVSLINSHFIRTTRVPGSNIWNIILGLDVAKNSIVSTATGGTVGGRLTLKADSVQLTNDNRGTSNNNKFRNILLSTDNDGIIRTSIRIATELDKVQTAEHIYNLLDLRTPPTPTVPLLGGSNRINNLITAETLFNLMRSIWGVRSDGSLDVNVNTNFQNVWLKPDFIHSDTANSPIIPSLALNNIFNVGARVTKPISTIQSSTRYFDVFRVTVHDGLFQSNGLPNVLSSINIGDSGSATDITLNWRTLTITKSNYSNRVLTTNGNSQVQNMYSFGYISTSGMGNTPLSTIPNQSVGSILDSIDFNTLSDNSTGKAHSGVSQQMTERIGSPDNEWFYTKILTGVHYRVIGGIFDKLISWLKNNFVTHNSKSTLPIGSVIAYFPTSINTQTFRFGIPLGFVPCFGGFIARTTKNSTTIVERYYVPDLRSKLVLGADGTLDGSFDANPQSHLTPKNTLMSVTGTNDGNFNIINPSVVNNMLARYIFPTQDSGSHNHAHTHTHSISGITSGGSNSSNKGHYHAVSGDANASGSQATTTIANSTSSTNVAGSHDHGISIVKLNGRNASYSGSGTSLVTNRLLYIMNFAIPLSAYDQWDYYYIPADYLGISEPSSIVTIPTITTILNTNLVSGVAQVSPLSPNYPNGGSLIVQNPNNPGIIDPGGLTPMNP
jgi:hypothetical protein